MVKSDVILKINRYSIEKKNDWDEFVTQAKNGYFFFYRSYMDYHKDRFMDHSLMIYKNERLIAILPSNESNNMLISHGGLTFGGFITISSLSISDMLEIFKELKVYMYRNGFKKLLYKSMPYIYHTVPSQEDLYALFINGAKIYRRDVSSTINFNESIRYSKGKKYGIKKANKTDILISKSEQYNQFIELLSTVLLDKYDVRPTHTMEEMMLLAVHHPNNIELYVASFNEEMIAGVIVFKDRKIIHTQYMASNNLGKKLGALDILIDSLLNKFKDDYNYFNFGISTEQNGLYLNEGLIRQKEMFGARAVVYDFYELEIR